MQNLGTREKPIQLAEESSLVSLFSCLADYSLIHSPSNHLILIICFPLAFRAVLPMLRLRHISQPGGQTIARMIRRGGELDLVLAAEQENLCIYDGLKWGHWKFLLCGDVLYTYMQP